MRLETETLQLLDIRQHKDFVESKIEGAISYYWHDVYKLMENQS